VVAGLARQPVEGSHELGPIREPGARALCTGQCRVGFAEVQVSSAGHLDRTRVIGEEAEHALDHAP